MINSNKNVFLYDPLLNINKDFDFSINNLLKFECIIIGNKMDHIDYKIINLYKQTKEVIEF